MWSLARLFRFDGYDLRDVSVSIKAARVTVDLERRADKPFVCYRCQTPLTAQRGHYRIKFQELDIMGNKTFVRLWRYKGHCPKCKKARSEAIEFISDETPHLSKLYSEWMGTMCEFGAVSRVARFCGQDNMTVRRVVLHRMQRMLKHYKIPEARRISVDEVYSRKKAKDPDESRDRRFFTVVTDLDTRRVIWVSEGRMKESLDFFFQLIGERATKKIIVVAMDQHDGYGASVRQNCPNATIVWDRFHIMQNFEEALNETRKDLHDELSPKDPSFPLTMGKYRFLFLKKANRRTQSEKSHIDQVFLENARFLQLELVKEAMVQFFNQADAETAKEVLDEITVWVWQAGFKPLKQYFDNLHAGWATLQNYFRYRVTTAVSEGINNVIKSLKRRAFGFRNMDYFRLKIMQTCGYLNSEFMDQKPALA